MTLTFLTPWFQIRELTKNFEDFQCTFTETWRGESIPSLKEMNQREVLSNLVFRECNSSDNINAT